MSLVSLLFTGNSESSAASQSKNVDTELDALFCSNVAPPILTPAITTSTSTAESNPASGRKRKRHQESSELEADRPSHASKVAASEARKAKKTVPVSVRSSPSSDGESDDSIDNDAGLEDAYLARRAVPKDEPSDIHESSENDEDDAPPQHETQSAISLKKGSKSHKKEKYVPPDESVAQRDARTIFIGNISIDVVRSKSLQKQLKKHITSKVSGARVESVRFRSVAFASATTKLPTEEGKPIRNTSASKKQQRQKARASTWRDTENNESNADDEHKLPKKPSFLTPAEKKRVAFIKGDFHKEVDTVNAYVVFAHAPPDRSADMLSPTEAAHLAVAHCDGTIFYERTIRVDRVGQWRAAAGVEFADEDKGDPRLTLFVGNLDFAAREEDLRVWFEGVVAQARGPRGVSDADEDGGKWVERVRIVRDRDTQLGKGFGYVRFADRECVDEMLALEPEFLKFAKRRLRLQRCKVVTPGGTSAAKDIPSSRTPATQKTARSTSEGVQVPAGDPLLGKKLAGLSKEDRKVAKAANVDRIQRRLAKKRAQANVKGELGKRDGKVRDRQRKKGGPSYRSKMTAHKGRLRSEKSMEKRNTKK